MAKNKDKVFSKVAETAKESDMMRMRRIDGSQNGATLRTRVVRDKTKYNRNLKHKKSLADAGDFPFYGALTPSIRLLRRRRNQYSIRLALRSRR
jgi:hypothetical protein